MINGADKDYVLYGPPLDYVAKYSSAGKLIYERLKEDPAFIGQIDAHTGYKYSFAEILDRSVRLALWLQDKGIRPGDVVAYVILNHKDAIIVLCATLFVGAVLSPWNALITIQEIGYFMRHTRPKIVICCKEAGTAVKAATEELCATPILVVHGELLGFIPFDDTQIHSRRKIDDFQCTEVEENDVALMASTSGTSATSKVIQRSHKSLLTVIQTINQRPYATGMVILSFAPICWLSGVDTALMSVIGKLHRVSASYVDERTTLEWIEKYQVNCFGMPTPRLLRMIYSKELCNYDLSSLKVMVASGGKLQVWHYEKFEKSALIGCKLIQAYGATEMGEAIAIHTGKNDPGSNGKLLAGMSAKIVDPKTGETISPYELGELCVKHPAMFSGYYNDPELSKAAIDSEGWYHTGDLAKFDEKEELWIIERLKDIIHVNEVRVFPTELEAVLALHPGVDTVGVVGKSVSSTVEHPVAFVVKTPGSTVTEKELCNFLETRLTDDAKQLRGGVRFVNNIPRSVSQKIKRWELRRIPESET